MYTMKFAKNYVIMSALTKLLNNKRTTTFFLSLIALISISPVAKAQQVLMESDRLLEYPYTWQGHSPRNEGECAQAAGQKLVGQINHMSNISQFDSFSNSNVNRSLSNEFENIGQYINNNTVFQDGRSSSTQIAAAQRGLVVSVSPKGFKTGTFGNSYKRNQLDGTRESKCWGTLLYDFVIYGPNAIVQRDDTDNNPNNALTIVHTLKGSPSSHTDNYANYKSWGGDNWRTWIHSNGQFKHQKEGVPSSHTDTIINYITWDGSEWTATVDPNRKVFRHTRKGASSGHEDTILNYVTWDGTQWTMRLQ